MPCATIYATAPLTLTAFYVLRMLARVLFGPRVERFAKFPDERKIDMVPLVVLGVFPGLLMDVVDTGVAPLAPLFELIQDAPTIIGGGH